MMLSVRRCKPSRRHWYGGGSAPRGVPKVKLQPQQATWAPRVSIPPSIALPRPKSAMPFGRRAGVLLRRSKATPLRQCHWYSRASTSAVPGNPRSVSCQSLIAPPCDQWLPLLTFYPPAIAAGHTHTHDRAAALRACSSLYGLYIRTPSSPRFSTSSQRLYVGVVNFVVPWARA